MAKSKSGGTRAMIRGRVGNDVYSIGLNGAGQKQQVVRSLAEVVANPRTEAQMRGRMIMSSIMQAVSTLRPIIDHSFDGVPAGQPSISEFIKLNYRLFKADVAAHPSASNNFGCVKYQEKGMQIGAYVVSNGSAIIPDGIQFSTNHGHARVQVGATLTYGALKAAWGMEPGEYLTLFTFIESADHDPSKGLTLKTARLSIKDGLDEATVLTAENAAAAFVIEGNVNPEFDLSDGELIIKVATDNDSYFYGISFHIISRKTESGYTHTKCTMDMVNNMGYTANVALPTYPVGSQMYLNGGEI